MLSLLYSAYGAPLVCGMRCGPVETPLQPTTTYHSLTQRHHQLLCLITLLSSPVSLSLECTDAEPVSDEEGLQGDKGLLSQPSIPTPTHKPPTQAMRANTQNNVEPHTPPPAAAQSQPSRIYKAKITRKDEGRRGEEEGWTMKAYDEGFSSEVLRMEWVV